MILFSLLMSAGSSTQGPQAPAGLLIQLRLTRPHSVAAPHTPGRLSLRSTALLLATTTFALRPLTPRGGSRFAQSSLPLRSRYGPSLAGKAVASFHYAPPRYTTLRCGPSLPGVALASFTLRSSSLPLRSRCGPSSLSLRRGGSQCASTCGYGGASPLESHARCAR